MGVLIMVLGVIGVGVALAAIVDVTVAALRTRHILDAVIVVAVAVVTVWLLVAYGDVLMQ